MSFKHLEGSMFLPLTVLRAEGTWLPDLIPEIVMESGYINTHQCVLLA